MFSLFRPLILSLGTLLLTILGVESLLYFFAPVADPYEKYKYSPPSLNQYIKSAFPPNLLLTTEPEPGLPGVAGTKTFSTNNMGFRGDYLATPKPQEEFRVFLIGGSTSECLYLDDSEALNKTLQDALAQRAPAGLSIRVYNAGKSGDASDDHVSMLVHRIVHLSPDMIIVFSGINDLTRSIYAYDYLHYQEETPPRRFPMFRAISTDFQIPRRLYYLMKQVNPTPKDVLETIGYRSRYKQKIALRKGTPVSNLKPRIDPTSYSHNLRSIIGVSKAQGIQLVFVTQQSTWNSTIDSRAKNWHWMLHRNGVTYREDYMHEALEALNDVKRRLAYQYSTPVYDLAREMSKSLNYFYDDVHFNVRGAMEAGKQLASHILAAVPFERGRKGTRDVDEGIPTRLGEPGQAHR